MALIDDLKAQYLTLQKSLSDAVAKVTFLQHQYAINHYGGQSPAQFAGYLAPAQAAVDSLNGQISGLAVQIQQAAEATPTPAAPDIAPQTSSPLFVPYAASVTTSSSGGGLFSSPLVLAGMIAVGAAVYWFFLRRRR